MPDWRSHNPSREERGPKWALPALVWIWQRTSSRFTESTVTNVLSPNASSRADKSTTTSRSSFPAGSAWKPVLAPRGQGDRAAVRQTLRQKPEERRQRRRGHLRSGGAAQHAFRHGQGRGPARRGRDRAAWLGLTPGQQGALVGHEQAGRQLSAHPPHSRRAQSSRLRPTRPTRAAAGSSGWRRESLSSAVAFEAEKPISPRRVDAHHGQEASPSSNRSDIRAPVAPWRRMRDLLLVSPSLFDQDGSQYRPHLRPNHRFGWPLHQEGLPRPPASRALQRPRVRQDVRLRNQPDDLAGREHLRPLKEPLAGGTVLQVDQAASSDEAVFRFVGECGQDANLDRGVGLGPGCHRQEAP